MILSDLHTHTNYCDGKSSPREMVLSAIDKGLSVLGFSVHSYTSFDQSFCIKQERIGEYIKEINALKEEFYDKIQILCGVEQDYYSDYPTDGFDYIIGSVHYIKSGDLYLSVDESASSFQAAVTAHFGGDYYAFCEEYYKTLSDVLNKTKADIIGHFDLVSKFNEGNRFFDETHPGYVKAYKKAVDALIPFDIPFEVNTGAISRGYKTEPYPSAPILSYIKEKGGKVILTSDSHSSDTLCFEFSKWGKFIEDKGFELLQRGEI